MLRLNKIIKAEFESANIDEIIKKISAHNLYDPIIKAISLINKHLKEVEYELNYSGSLQVSHIATTLLIKINECFRDLKLKNAEKEKDELEYILGNIFRRILVQITTLHPEEKKIRFATVIYIALKETCELYNYDFIQLMSFLGIENLANEKIISGNNSSIVNPTINTSQIPCYIWNSGSQKEFSTFVRILKKHKITTEIKKIEQLFNNPTKNLAIKLDEKRTVFVLQFFSYLYDTKFVVTNGCGFYQVLQCHACDFNTKFLKNKTTQRMVYKVKKMKGWKPTKEMLEKDFINIIKS